MVDLETKIIDAEQEPPRYPHTMAGVDRLNGERSRIGELLGQVEGKTDDGTEDVSFTEAHAIAKALNDHVEHDLDELVAALGSLEGESSPIDDTRKEQIRTHLRELQGQLAALRIRIETRLNTFEIGDIIYVDGKALRVEEKAGTIHGDEDLFCFDGQSFVQVRKGDKRVNREEPAEGFKDSLSERAVTFFSASLPFERREAFQYKSKDSDNRGERCYYICNERVVEVEVVREAIIFDEQDTVQSRSVVVTDQGTYRTLTETSTGNWIVSGGTREEMGGVQFKKQRDFNALRYAMYCAPSFEISRSTFSTVNGVNFVEGDEIRTKNEQGTASRYRIKKVSVDGESHVILLEDTTTKQDRLIQWDESAGAIKIEADCPAFFQQDIQVVRASSSLIPDEARQAFFTELAFSGLLKPGTPEKETYIKQTNLSGEPTVYQVTETMLISPPSGQASEAQEVERSIRLRPVNGGFAITVDARAYRKARIQGTPFEPVTDAEEIARLRGDEGEIVSKGAEPGEGASVDETSAATDVEGALQDPRDPLADVVAAVEEAPDAPVPEAAEPESVAVVEEAPVEEEPAVAVDQGADAAVPPTIEASPSEVPDDIREETGAIGTEGTVRREENSATQREKRRLLMQLRRGDTLVLTDADGAEERHSVASTELNPSGQVIAVRLEDGREMRAEALMAYDLHREQVVQEATDSRVVEQAKEVVPGEEEAGSPEQAREYTPIQLIEVAQIVNDLEKGNRNLESLTDEEIRLVLSVRLNEDLSGIDVGEEREAYVSAIAVSLGIERRGERVKPASGENPQQQTEVSVDGAAPQEEQREVSRYVHVGAEEISKLYEGYTKRALRKVLQREADTLARFQAAEPHGLSTWEDLSIQHLVARGYLEEVDFDTWQCTEWGAEQSIDVDEQCDMIMEKRFDDVPSIVPTPRLRGDVSISDQSGSIGKREGVVLTSKEIFPDVTRTEEPFTLERPPLPPGVEEKSQREINLNREKRKILFMDDILGYCAYGHTPTLEYLQRKSSIELSLFEAKEALDELVARGYLEYQKERNTYRISPDKKEVDVDTYFDKAVELGIAEIRMEMEASGRLEILRNRLTFIREALQRIQENPHGGCALADFDDLRRQYVSDADASACANMLQVLVRNRWVEREARPDGDGSMYVLTEAGEVATFDVDALVREELEVKLAVKQLAEPESNTHERKTTEEEETVSDEEGSASVIAAPKKRRFSGRIGKIVGGLALAGTLIAGAFSLGGEKKGSAESGKASVERVLKKEKADKNDPVIFSRGERGSTTVSLYDKRKNKVIAHQLEAGSLVHYDENNPNAEVTVRIDGEEQTGKIGVVGGQPALVTKTATGGVEIHYLP